jgi:putative DNA primase/helicase
LGKKDHWESGKPKGPKIPYMLPNLLKVPAETPVWIAEGEKDAETILDLGLEATTASEGAGKWTSDLNKWFEGRKTVYVLEDNDAPGHRHALKVARNLVDVVGEVRIVRFNDLEEGTDVSDWVEKGGTKEQLLERALAAPVFKNRATIKVTAGDLARTADETTRAMLAAQLPVLVRAGKLVEPIWTERLASKERKIKVTVLRAMTTANLLYMVNKHAASFVKWDGRSKKELVIDPPEKMLLMLLQLGHWPFPHVVGIINSPTMRPDGSIISDPGYDATTQLWYEPAGDLTLPTIADDPSKDDAAAALELLKGLLVEVKFKNKRLDQAVALAAILTAALRGAFELAPMILFLAHELGTGKSWLVDLIAMIVTGRRCPVITFHSTTEEMEKRLGALLLEGPPLISVDNLSKDLEGDLLAQMVERPLVKARILGKSEMPECEWRGVLFGTGNNVRLVGDMTRRGLICNLDAAIERPEKRKFELDPLAMVVADRGKYIGAALTIARAYLARGQRVTCTPLGSYGDWSRFVREPLIWLGEEDPVISMDQARKDDPKRSALRELIEQWSAHLGTERAYKVGEIIDTAKETKPTEVWAAGTPNYERVRPEFYNVLVEQAGSARGLEVDVKLLGNWLRVINGQVLDGHRIVVATESKSHGNRWKLEKVE